MPDIRSKVAYERAARLLDVERAKHHSDGEKLGNEMCVFCNDPWFTHETYYGCTMWRTLFRLSEDIRSLKKEA